MICTSTPAGHRRDVLRTRCEDNRCLSTVHVLDSGKERHKIRLAGIDAPERRQAFGKHSKEYLADLVAGESVVVDWSKRD